MPALFLIIGIKLIINNSLSLGSLIGFVSIVTMVMKPILSLVSSYNDFLLLNVYFQKLSEVLTYEEKNDFNNKKEMLEKKSLFIGLIMFTILYLF